MHIGAETDEASGEEEIDDNVFAQLLAFQRRQRTCFGCGKPDHVIGDCPEYEIKKKGIMSVSSTKKPFKKPFHRKNIHALTSSPGEELDCDEDEATDSRASDAFTSDIDLDQKVASVIRHETHSSSDESSIDDYDLHRDGFTFGDFDHTVTAISADFSVSIDDLSGHLIPTMLLLIHMSMARSKSV